MYARREPLEGRRNHLANVEMSIVNSLPSRVSRRAEWSLRATKMSFICQVLIVNNMETLLQSWVKIRNPYRTAFTRPSLAFLRPILKSPHHLDYLLTPKNLKLIGICPSYRQNHESLPKSVWAGFSRAH